MMAGALVDRVRAREAGMVKAVVQKIAHEAPKLGDLRQEDLERLARALVAEELKGDLRRAVTLERIPYVREREAYLEAMGRRSPHSQRSYRKSLEVFEAWCSRKGIAPLDLSYAQADDFIESLKAAGLSPATVAARVAAPSSLFSWFERRHAEVRNPFRGTRARPRMRATRRIAVPTAEEMATIREAAGATMRAAIVLMADLGLRVGALPELVIRGGRYVGFSKGKDVAGDVPESVLAELRRAGLSLSAPFGTMTAATIADRFRYLTAKLHREGKLQARYSVHDLRHAFAVRLYTETKDIYRVSKALGHAGIAVTEHYLRSLGLER